tara:strand:+ start:1523 stop:1981 length:459 start_codon:yes stop_codon:yes gene_type:complete
MFEFFDIYLYVTIKLKRLLLMKTQLLCTFTDIQNYNEIIKQVSSFYDILYGKVYALQNRDNLDEIYLTYNINSALLDNNNFFNNTISVHRKKDSNTIYTINSLNMLIKHLNNGLLDLKFQINWNNYLNCILLTSATGDLRKIDTKLFKIENI